MITVSEIAVIDQGQVAAYDVFYTCDSNERPWVLRVTLTSGERLALAYRERETAEDTAKSLGTVASDVGGISSVESDKREYE